MIQIKLLRSFFIFHRLELVVLKKEIHSSPLEAFEALIKRIIKYE